MSLEQIIHFNTQHQTDMHYLRIRLQWLQDHQEWQKRRDLDRFIAEMESGA